MTSLIEKLLAVANGIPDDKVRHALGGAVLFTIIAPFDSHVAYATVVTAAIVKEIYDRLHSSIHTPDVWDAVATVAGGSVGLVCFAAGAGYVW